MSGQPHFILITGPNGAGKSTFINVNRERLNEYIIVQPDENQEWRQAVTEALLHKNNFVLESPWNSNAVNEILDRIDVLGYHTSLYQLYLNHPKQSWERVNERNKIINRTLDFDSVMYTFNENFKNVFKAYHTFDESYFINVVPEELNLKLAFFKTELVFLFPNQDNFLITFREVGAKKGYVSDIAYGILLMNKRHVTPSFQFPMLK